MITAKHCSCIAAVDIFLSPLSLERGNSVKPFNFIVIEDPHYFAKSLDACGEGYEAFMDFEQKCYAETAAINDAVFDYLEKQTFADVILFGGDLSFNGEKASHEEFSEKLRKLQDSGKACYVVTAGHDIEPNPFEYNDEKGGRHHIEGISFREQYDYYRDFGYDKAISFYKENLSYAAQIGEGVRLLVLCNDSEESRNVPYSDELMKWAEEQAKQAKADKQVMIAMEHYPLLPGQPIFTLVPDARQKESRRVINMLADNGVHICFTGHMHNNSINETKSDNGNKFYDVCTGSIIGHPAYMRHCTIEDENTIDIKAVPIPDFEWKGISEGQTCKEYMKAQFERMLRTIIGGMKDNPEKVLSKFGAADKKALYKPVQAVGKVFATWPVGKIARLLCVKADKSIKDMPFIELAVNIVRNLFEGNQPYVEGTPEGDVILKVFKRLNPVWKILNKKLRGSQGEQLDMFEILKHTAGNYGISDYDAKIKFN